MPYYDASSYDQYRSGYRDADLAGPSSLRMGDESTMSDANDSSTLYARQVDSQTTAGMADGANGGHTNASTRKKRIHFSCIECHRRKQRCDRKEPCQHCISRNVPHRCKYLVQNDGKPEKNAQTSETHAERTSNGIDGIQNGIQSHERNGVSFASSPALLQEATNNPSPASQVGTSELAELRQQMNQGFAAILDVVNRKMNAADYGHASHLSTLGKRKQSSLAFSSTGSLLSLRSQSGSEEEEDPNDYVVLISMNVSTTRGSQLLDMLSTANTHSLFDPSRSIDVNASIDNVMWEISMRDLRGAGPLSQSMLNVLPSEERMKELLKLYLSDAFLLPLPVSPKSMTRMIEKAAAMRTRGFIKTDEINSFAVVAALLSLATAKAQARELPAHEVTALYRQARAMVFACTKALYTADVMGRLDSDRCLAYQMAARFLFYDRRLNEAYLCIGSAIRTAQVLGLHKLDDETAMGTKPAWQVEEERVLWCSLRFDERSFCVMLERPSTIDDRICHTTPPPPSSSLSSAEAAAVVERHEMATMQGEILMLLHSGGSRGVSMRRVLALDEEIEAWRTPFPDGPRHDDSDEEARFARRFFIPLHIHQSRLALLRPFFLRQISKTASSQVRKRHAEIRRRCVQTACDDASMREAMIRAIQSSFKEETAPGSVRKHIRTPRWFTSLIICGAYLLTAEQPSSISTDNTTSTSGNNGDSQSHTLDVEQDRLLIQSARQHIHTFVDIVERRQREGEQRDLTLDREVSILRMFLQKSGEKAVARFKSEGKKRSRPNVTDNAGGKTNGITPYDYSSSSVALAGSTETGGAPAFVGDRMIPNSSMHPSPTAGAGVQMPLSMYNTPPQGPPGSSNNSPSADGDDLQTILDAWFQSDSQMSMLADLPTTFDMQTMFGASTTASTSEKNNAMANAVYPSQPQASGLAAAQQSSYYPTPPASMSSTVPSNSTPGMSFGPSSMASGHANNINNNGAGNVGAMASNGFHGSVGGVPSSGNFWEGFINLLSNQSSTVK